MASQRFAHSPRIVDVWRSLVPAFDLEHNRKEEGAVLSALALLEGRDSSLENALLGVLRMLKAGTPVAGTSPGDQFGFYSVQGGLKTGVVTNGAGVATVNFEVAFPVGCLFVLPVSATAGANIQFGSASRSNFVITGPLSTTLALVYGAVGF